MWRILTIAALILLPRMGWSQSLADDERRFDLLRAHQVRLERQLVEQGKRISRLKAQKPGVGRDYQLNAALRQSQQLADRATGLQGLLREAHEALLKRYDHALAAAADASQRAALAKRRASRTMPKTRSWSRIVTDDAASPDDSPEDLEEKADLLKDSEEKVLRQVRRMRQRLTHLEHRARLQRHATSADNSPFVETAPRRTSRTYAAKSVAPARAAEPTAPEAGGGGGSPTAIAGDGASKSNSADPSATPSPAPPAQSSEFDSATGARDDYAPAPALPAGGGSWNCSGGSCADPGVTVSVTVRDALDPGLLDKLGRVGGSGDLRDRIAALKKAEGDLQRLAGKLSTRATALRKRATQLRKHK